MPYIKLPSRLVIDQLVELIEGDIEEGEITYLFYKILKNAYGKDTSKYADRIKALGILESCKLEYYRRILVPYEEKKIKENGDVE